MAEKREKVKHVYLESFSRIFYTLEPLICFVSLVLQIVGFSTNAWAIQKDNEKNRLTKFGLWSTTVCYDLDCITRTHYDEYRENMSKGYTRKGVQYALQLGHEVTTTIALASIAICFILSVVHFFIRIWKRQIMLGMLITSFISGTLLLTTIGYHYGELSAFQQIPLNKLQYTFYHPWGLTSSFVGAVIIVLNGVVLTFLACCRRSLKRRKSYETVVTQKQDIPVSVPHQCADDYDPPDYNDLEDDEEDSEEDELVDQV